MIHCVKLGCVKPVCFTLRAFVGSARRRELLEHHGPMARQVKQRSIKSLGWLLGELLQETPRNRWYSIYSFRFSLFYQSKDKSWETPKLNGNKNNGFQSNDRSFKCLFLVPAWDFDQDLLEHVGAFCLLCFLFYPQ